MFDVRTERCGSQIIHVLEDRATGSSARILVGFGFNCFSFHCRVGGVEHELLHSEPGFAELPTRGTASGTPILFPFPNRIRCGRFEFDGRQFRLPLDRRGMNAIHGFVVELPWRVTSIETSGVAKVRGEFQLSRDAPEIGSLWPADFVIELTYALTGNRLTNRFRVTNPDTRPLPWGFGTHAYFRLPLVAGGDESCCSVRVPASAVWELDEFLPTGRTRPVAGATDLRAGRALAGLTLDDILSGLEFDGGWCRSTMTDLGAGVEVSLRFDSAFRELVVYTPPARGSICLEPYTCVTDAINLEPRGVDAGLRVLAPGASDAGTIELEARAN